MYKNCTARSSHLSWTHLSGLMNPWSSLEFFKKLQKICHMLLLMMDLKFGGNFFVTAFLKLCRIMIWIMGPSQKKELQNQGCSQMESLKLLWVSPASAPGCSSSSPYYSAFHALLVLHLDHMPVKIEGYHMTHDHLLSMISIPITTRECGFSSHTKKAAAAHDTCEVNFVASSITMHNIMWCLLSHILHCNGNLTFGDGT